MTALGRLGRFVFAWFQSFNQLQINGWRSRVDSSCLAAWMDNCFSAMIPTPLPYEDGRPGAAFPGVRLFLLPNIDLLAPSMGPIGLFFLQCPFHRAAYVPYYRLQLARPIKSFRTTWLHVLCLC